MRTHYVSVRNVMLAKVTVAFQTALPEKMKNENLKMEIVSGCRNEMME